jgi:hypothetical protein
LRHEVLLFVYIQCLTDDARNFAGQNVATCRLRILSKAAAECLHDLALARSAQVSDHGRLLVGVQDLLDERRCRAGHDGRARFALMLPEAVLQGLHGAVVSYRHVHHGYFGGLKIRYPRCPGAFVMGANFVAVVIDGNA